MNSNELEGYLNLIHEREKRKKINNRATWSHIVSNGKRSLEYEHADTLINLYQNLESEELKNHFLSELNYDVTYGAEESNGRMEDGSVFYCSTIALSFFVLIKLGFKDDAIDSFKNRWDRTSGSILELLHDMFLEDFSDFNISQLNSIANTVKNVALNEYDRHLRHNVLTYLTDNAFALINKEISRVNIEINRDKTNLIAIIRYLNLDEKYDIFLAQIDQYINTADSIVTSGMVSNFRSFIEDILKDLAKKISSKSNQAIPKDPGKAEMGNIRAFLKLKLELTDADNNLINKYVDVLHAEGGHSFISNIEYFRLSKNIGIEILLLLLSKFKKLFP